MYLGSNTPIGIVPSNQSVWTIQYAGRVRRPSVDAFIRFYSKSSHQEVYRINARTNVKRTVYENSTLTLFTSMTWDEVKGKRISCI